MHFLDLPADIISIFPHYFHSIYDLYSVTITCRTLGEAYRDAPISLPPVLPKLYGQALFSPHPHLILAGTCRQIADWAVVTPSRRYELFQTLLDGHAGLLLLAERVARVSLSDLRHLHSIKYSILNPITRLVDFEVGPAMVRNQEIEPDEYGLTICQFPDLALLNHVIYCELFHHYIDDILLPTSSPPSNLCPLELGIRQRFVAYCIPDANNHRHHAWRTLGGRGGQWQVLDNIQFSQSDSICRRDEALTRFFQTSILQALPEDEQVPISGHPWDWEPTHAEKRSALFVLVASHLSWTSLQMLLLDGLATDANRTKLAEIKHAVDALPDALIGRWPYWGSSENPDPDAAEALEREWCTWFGLSSDCHEGMGTNQLTDEDIMRETKRWEETLEARARGKGASHS